MNNNSNNNNKKNKKRNDKYKENRRKSDSEKAEMGGEVELEAGSDVVTCVRHKSQSANLNLITKPSPRRKSNMGPMKCHVELPFPLDQESGKTSSPNEWNARKDTEIADVASELDL